ncbi:MAG TPA: sigma-70 family RNA polymerase sigma factor [Steroidobacteraceae bacterium]|nr:sigma-70 family RNA polymerase sigma factor [Steroidobacteraceae bacterium]
MEASSKDRMPLGDARARRFRGEDSSRPTDAAEQALLRRVAGGDREAFRELYVGYHLRLARFLTRLTRRFDVAEEIINDTLWVVWRKAPEFRGGSKVSTWIMGIAYRRALKTLRRLNLGSQVPLGDESAATVERDAAHDETGDLRDWLDQALIQLPADQRLVIELTYYQGLSCAEVAQVTDCPVNTVKTRMFHARRKLRLLLPRLDGSAGGTHTP